MIGTLTRKSSGVHKSYRRQTHEGGSKGLSKQTKKRFDHSLIMGNLFHDTKNDGRLTAKKEKTDDDYESLLAPAFDEVIRKKETTFPSPPTTSFRKKCTTRAMKVKAFAPNLLMLSKLS